MGNGQVSLRLHPLNLSLPLGRDFADGGLSLWRTKQKAGRNLPASEKERERERRSETHNHVLFETYMHYICGNCTKLLCPRTLQSPANRNPTPLSQGPIAEQCWASVLLPFSLFAFCLKRWPSSIHTWKQEGSDVARMGRASPAQTKSTFRVLEGTFARARSVKTSETCVGTMI